MKKYDTIYLIDDFDIVNFLHEKLLKKLDFDGDIIPHTIPEKALSEISSFGEKSNPVLVLLDINMPSLSGFEFLETMIHEQYPLIFDVVIVSSSLSKNDEILANQYPSFVIDYVVKPLTLERLRAILLHTRPTDTVIEH